MKLHELAPAEGSRKTRNRVGRGLGSANPNNMVRATMEGLKSLKKAEDVAALRGKTVAEILG